ncbi:oxidoreductase [Streptomyces olivochromogenes]|uniref:Oxidoreductase n=1 Tax=Streptomyces olivochromogenes TaxID=1963 RepID=A0A250VSI7_STROL|nr:oxidoreductase [Streptomyces olivochromogenes]
MDASATVDATGPGTDFTPGQRVMAYVNPLHPYGGAQAECIVTPQDHAAPLPDEADLHDATGLPMNGLTAHQALTHLALPVGATIAVTGLTRAPGGYAVQPAAYQGLRASLKRRACTTGITGCDAVFASSPIRVIPGNGQGPLKGPRVATTPVLWHGCCGWPVGPCEAGSRRRCPDRPGRGRGPVTKPSRDTAMSAMMRVMSGQM